MAEIISNMFRRNLFTSMRAITTRNNSNIRGWSEALGGNRTSSILSKRSISKQATEFTDDTWTTKEERKNFIAIYPEVRNLVSKMMHPFIVEKYRKFFDYNVPTGRGYRAILMLKLYDALAPESVRNSVTHFELYTTAWLIEMAIYLLIDDVLDDSTYRRGKLCWYKENREAIALDVLRLYVSVFKVLKEVSGGSHYYENTASLFHEMSLRVLTGEAMDNLGKNAVRCDNLENYYSVLVRLKTDYSCRLPFDTAMFLAGYQQIPFSDKLYKIYGDLSYIFQMLNDRLDYQGAPSDGKIKGEDVGNGDLTWFLIKALEEGSDKQKQIIREHYGRKDDDSVRKVYEVFEDLRLMDKCSRTQTEIMSNIKFEINDIPNDSLRNFLMHLPDRVFTFYMKNHFEDHPIPS